MPQAPTSLISPHQREPLQKHDLQNRKQTLPRHIAVEGPIGVGKTTLAKKLADSLNYSILLEKAEENPVLERFYANKPGSALATQLFFLFQRAQQLEELRQEDLFEPVRVSDFLIQKDRLFAKLNLDADEFTLYERVFQQLTLDAPVPDLVIYLQAPVDVLQRRIRQRGVAFEQRISNDYLHAINETYSEFFLYYDQSPLLIVNAAEIDFANSARDYDQLLEYLLNIRSGRHFFNPALL